MRRIQFQIPWPRFNNWRHTSIRSANTKTNFTVGAFKLYIAAHIYPHTPNTPPRHTHTHCVFPRLMNSTRLRRMKHDNPCCPFRAHQATIAQPNQICPDIRFGISELHLFLYRVLYDTHVTHWAAVLNVEILIKRHLKRGWFPWLLWWIVKAALCAFVWWVVCGCWYPLMRKRLVCVCVLDAMHICVADERWEFDRVYN